MGFTSTTAAATAARGAGRTNGEEHAEMLLADQDKLRAPGASTPGGGTANLFWKKATLPQPSSLLSPPLSLPIPSRRRSRSNY
jgi:cullin-4